MVDDVPLLEARGVRVAYGDRPPVVDGLDLTIRPGEVVGLLGESGCGKSTAAYALLGLVRPPGRITGGSVAFEGRDLLRLRGDALRAIRGRDIGLIVQNPRGALNPMLRVGEQIGTVWRAHQAGDARARAIEMLRLVGINDPERRVDSYAHELSGGMAQRVLIAIALSSTPRLLIADEPTSGLDVTIQAQFLDRMWAATRETGSAILLVTQETGIIANYCDRVLVMQRGRVVDDLPTRRFFHAPTHPASRELLAVAEAKAEEDLPIIADHSPDGRPVLIDVDAISRFFGVRGTTKRVQAVSDVSFRIRAGETLGLVGESGSGKTTVGRCLLRLLEPSEGRIRHRGTPLDTLSRRDMRKFRAKIQIVLQDPYDSLDPRWTVRRSLREPLDLHSRQSGARKRRRIDELLRLVDLPPHVALQKPRDMGSGALQRVSIARALASAPEFIVLDEPTSVLAPSARLGLVRLLRRLQRELGLSYLFISHDLTTVSQVCHRVAVMYLSQIVEVGDTEQIFKRPRHPYTKTLLASHLFPDPDNRRVDRERLETLAGEIPSPIDLPKGCYLVGRCAHAVARCVEEKQKLAADNDGRLLRCWRALAGELDAPETAEAVHAA